jgi:hypothetical protein
MDPEQTQEMMHVPPLAEVVERVDARLRTIAAIVASAVDAGRTTAPKEAAEAAELLKSAVRWLDRLSDHNRHYRRVPAASDSTIATRLQVAFDNAVGALRGLDEKQFRRRATLHSFDKSHGEGVFGCVLAVGDVLYRAADKATAIDRDLYSKIYERVLANPPIPELRFVDAATQAE